MSGYAMNAVPVSGPLALFGAVAAAEIAFLAAFAEDGLSSLADWKDLPLGVTIIGVIIWLGKRLVAGQDRGVEEVAKLRETNIKLEAAQSQGVVEQRAMTEKVAMLIGVVADNTRETARLAASMASFAAQMGESTKAQLHSIQAVIDIQGQRTGAAVDRVLNAIKTNRRRIMEQLGATDDEADDEDTKP